MRLPFAAIALAGMIQAANAAPPCATYPIKNAVVALLKQSVDVYGNELGGLDGEPLSLGGGLPDMQMCGADAMTNIGQININYTVALASRFGPCADCGVLTSDRMYLVKINGYWPVNEQGRPR